MNWRATLPSMLWFTLLGPLLLLGLAAFGTVVNAVKLGPSLAHSDGLLLALSYAYMLFGLPCLGAGLIFGVARGLSLRGMDRRVGALVAGALSGSAAGVLTSVVAMFLMASESLAGLALGASLGLIIGAVCGLFTHLRASSLNTRSRIDA